MKILVAIYDLIMFLGRLLVKLLIGLYVLIKSIAYSVSALIASIALLIIALSLSIYLISVGVGLKDSAGFNAWREEVIQTHREYYEQKQEKRLMRKLSTENFTVAEITDVSCTVDTECVTPNDYLIRSNCPYTSRCLQNKCSIICPEPYKDLRK